MKMYGMCYVVFLCVTSAQLAASTPIADGDFTKCGPHLCDGKLQYCDPLIHVCTPCALPCSRSSVADRNLCERLCSAYLRSIRPAASPTTSAPKVNPSESTSVPYSLIAIAVLCVVVLLTVVPSVVIFVYMRTSVPSSENEAGPQTPMLTANTPTDTDAHQTPKMHVIQEEQGQEANASFTRLHNTPQRTAHDGRNG